jgi:hypothetical protein
MTENQNTMTNDLIALAAKLGPDAWTKPYGVWEEEDEVERALR